MADPDTLAEPVARARREPVGIPRARIFPAAEPRALGGSGRFPRRKHRAASKPSSGSVGPVEREPRRRPDIREQVGKLIAFARRQATPA